MLGIPAIFILGQHYAVADHLFPPAYMHMTALYTVWYNYVKQRESLMGLSRDGGRYQGRPEFCQRAAKPSRQSP